MRSTHDIILLLVRRVVVVILESTPLQLEHQRATFQHVEGNEVAKECKAMQTSLQQNIHEMANERIQYCKC